MTGEVARIWELQRVLVDLALGAARAGVPLGVLDRYFSADEGSPRRSFGPEEYIALLRNAVRDLIDAAIEHGISRETPESRGSTPLEQAIAEGRRLVEKYGADQETGNEGRVASKPVGTRSDRLPGVG